MATPTVSRVPPKIGLVVFAVTGLALGAVLGLTLSQGVGTLQAAAAAFAALCGAIAAFTMFAELRDVWLRGRSASAGLLRALVNVAILAAMATSLLGHSAVVPIVLLPAMAVYFINQRRVREPVDRRPQASGATSAAQAAATKSRQRRGGKKHR